MSGDPIGDVIRTAHNQRASESMNRVFRRSHNNEPDDGEASEFVNLDAGATSPPIPRETNANKFFREVFEEAVGAKQIRRRYGRG
jgi:hypothetical protein